MIQLFQIVRFNHQSLAGSCQDISIKDSEIHSEYMLLHSHHVKIDYLKFTGKYSFQYMHDLEITNSYLDTKDAFWHSNNVIVKDSVVKGEYLGMFFKKGHIH